MPREVKNSGKQHSSQSKNYRILGDIFFILHFLLWSPRGGVGRNKIIPQHILKRKSYLQIFNIRNRMFKNMIQRYIDKNKSIYFTLCFREIRLQSSYQRNWRKKCEQLFREKSKEVKYGWFLVILWSHCAWKYLQVKMSSCTCALRHRNIWRSWDIAPRFLNIGARWR